MNFRTRLSYNNRLLFVYKDGHVKQTRFVEVSYFGDNYVLAKCSDSIFYTLLDLDGNELSEETHVVHRFQNGLLLTYNFFEKKYKSSDGISYVINYNVYKALNFDTGKSFVVNVIQSDNLLNTDESDFLKNKHWKVTVKEFLNKPVYCFKDFVFSELLDNQYLIVASYFDFNNAKKQLEKSISLATRYELNKIKSSAMIYNGYALVKLGQTDVGLQTANDGLKIAKEYGFNTVLSNGFLVLSDINQIIGNYKESNAFLKQHMTLSDSLLELKRESLSPEKRIQVLLNNQTEFQKQQAADLEEQKEANSLSKLTTILSIALITILSLLTLSLYKNNNIRLKTNNMLHKKNGELIIAKEKAELASKTKANFLSTVTHELRTPLYAVTGLTNMLLDEDPKPNQLQHLKSLKFSGEYLLTFINDILQINKIEANKVDIEPENFNLKKKITNVIAALNNSALDNNIQMHFEYDSD